MAYADNVQKATPPLTGAERVVIDTLSPQIVMATTAQIAALANAAQFDYGTNTAAASTTLTAANISGGTTENDLAMTGSLTAGANATLPTVAALYAALPAALQVPGATYKLRLLNESSGAFAWTVLTNTGWTLSGTMTIAQTTYRDFIVTIVSATAATLQDIGGGTIV
jgi:hypothetical protein